MFLPVMPFIRIAGIFAVTRAIFFPVDIQAFGMIGIFHFVLLLIGQPRQLTGIAGPFVPLGIVRLGRFGSGNLRLEDGTGYMGRYAATAHIILILILVGVDISPLSTSISIIGYNGKKMKIFLAPAISKELTSTNFLFEVRNKKHNNHPI